MKVLKRQACAKFQSQIFDESEVIQILKSSALAFYLQYKLKTIKSFQVIGTVVHIIIRVTITLRKSHTF